VELFHLFLLEILGEGGGENENKKTEGGKDCGMCHRLVVYFSQKAAPEGNILLCRDDGFDIF